MANYGINSASVLKNNGDGTFGAEENYAAGQFSMSVFALDLDEDGAADLAVANAGDDDVSVLINCIFTSSTHEVSGLADAGPGSLREAIGWANAHVGPDVISFTVAGSIQPTTPLPALSDATGGTVIDGLTAPGATPGHPTVIFDGSLISSGAGIEIVSSGNVVRGLAITNFPGAGVEVTNPAAEFNTVSQNLIYENGALGIDLATDDAADGVDTIFWVRPDSEVYMASTAHKKSIVELHLAERYLGVDTVADPSGYGEAWQYLDSDTADDITGHWSFPAIHTRAWSFATVTETDTLGTTSEFALNRHLIPDSLIFTAFSPVHLIVIAPNGQDSIGPEFNSFGSAASYDETTDWGPGPDGIPGKPDERITITNIRSGEYLTKIIPDPGGTGDYFFGIRVDGTEVKWAHTDATGQDTTRQFVSTPYSNPVPAPGVTVYVGFTPMPQRRGDLIWDGVYNVQDVVEEINHAFRSKALPYSGLLADINCDGFACNIQDVVKLIDHVFRGGAEPCP